MQYGVYVDWFDSVGGILISIELFEDDEYDYVLWNRYITKEKDFEDGTYKTLNEARTKAIEKANELYND